MDKKYRKASPSLTLVTPRRGAKRAVLQPFDAPFWQDGPDLWGRLSKALRVLKRDAPPIAQALVRHGERLANAVQRERTTT